MCMAYDTLTHTHTNVESRTQTQCDKFVNVHVALSMLRCMYMCHKMRTGHANKPMATTNDSMVRWARLCVLYTSHTHHSILDWMKIFIGHLLFRNTTDVRQFIYNFQVNRYGCAHNLKIKFWIFVQFFRLQL